MTPEKLMELKNWAVVGVKQDEDQYAYKIFQILKEKGYTVYPVNPKEDDIDGYKCYSKVSDIPGQVDVVDMVVNPVTGLKLLDSIEEKNIKYLWLQPGSHNKEFIEEVEKRGFIYVQDCILARLKLRRK
jgi:uncharacterized protein